MNWSQFDSGLSPEGWMKDFLLLAMQVEQNPSLKCPQCGGDRGIYMTAGPAIYNMTHQPGCNLRRGFDEWINTEGNFQKIQNIRGNR